MLGALDRVMAVIEFATDGSIILANGNFEAAMGYGLGEIQAGVTACSSIRLMRTVTAIASSGSN